MQIRLFNRPVSLPASRLARTILGCALVIGGMLGFLPILGFWMIPLGLIVLSVDSPLVRRWRRKAEVWFSRRFRGKVAASAANGRQSGKVD